MRKMAGRVRYGPQRRLSWQPLRSNSLPRNETAGRVPPQAASCRLRVLHLVEAIVQAPVTLAAVALVPFGCIELSVSSAPRLRRRTFTKLYTSLTVLNTHAAIRIRPQFNPECRVSKAHRNILCCRFAERKVILAEVSPWAPKLNPDFNYFCIYCLPRVIIVLQFCIKNYYKSFSGFLRLRIQSGGAENVRGALPEDISIGGTG